MAYRTLLMDRTIIKALLFLGELFIFTIILYYRNGEYYYIMECGVLIKGGVDE